MIFFPSVEDHSTSQPMFHSYEELFNSLNTSTSPPLPPPPPPITHVCDDLPEILPPPADILGDPTFMATIRLIYQKRNVPQQPQTMCWKREDSTQWSLNQKEKQRMHRREEAARVASKEIKESSCCIVYAMQQLLKDMLDPCDWRYMLRSFFSWTVVRLIVISLFLSRYFYSL